MHFRAPVFPRMKNPILAGFLQSADRLLAYQSALLIAAFGFSSNRVQHLHPKLSMRAFRRTPDERPFGNGC